MTNKCTVNGALAALPGLNADAVCDSFERDLAQAMGDQPAPDGLMIALTVQKRGAINAQFSRETGGETISYPVVSVDAIDRALRPGDLGRLAQVAAQMLKMDNLDNLVSRAATSKGD